MKNKLRLIALGSLLLGACATLGSQGQFAAGRQALDRGDSNTALENFKRVVQEEPNYFTTSAVLRQSIWTYMGRAQYNLGNFGDARTSFEKALDHIGEDRVARLYLGLTLLRQPIPQIPKGAFTPQDLSYALREGIPTKRIVTLLRERSIAFDFTKEIETQLKAAGADALLLDEIKKTSDEIISKRKAGGDRARGRKEIESALQGLQKDLEFAIANTPQGRFWDPTGEIRSQVQNGLLLLSSRDPDWPKIISTGEWVGLKIEEEIDKASRDESDEIRRRQQR